MKISRRHGNREHGQIMVMALVLLTLSSTLFAGLFQVSLTVQEKIRLQTAVDMAVLSAMNCEANGLNSVALANRAILANDALAGQFTALACETTFYRKMAQRFEKLLRLVPYAGPISRFVSKSIHTVERIAKRTAGALLPVANYLNIILDRGQKSVLFLMPACSLRAATATLRKNMPGARITPPSRALLLRQGTSLVRRVSGTDPAGTRTLKKGTMDGHTLKRNWRIQVAGLSPVKKTGGTDISVDDLLSHDRLKLKVLKRFRWRWKTVISSRTRASDFGYRTPADLLSMDTEKTRLWRSIPILVSSRMPAPVFKDFFKDRDLFALSAGELIYQRGTNPGESPNLFNPFWRARLMPVAMERTARQLVPDAVLKEVLH